MKSFTIYEEYYDLITLLNEEEQKNLLLSIFKYMFEDKIPNLTDRENKVFINLKRPLDKSKNQSTKSLKRNQTSNRMSNRMDNQTGNQTGNQKGNRTGNTSKMYMSMSNVNVYVKKIIEYLNKKVGTNYKNTTVSTINKIKARLNEGYKLDDFIVVIDKKTAEWKGTDLEKYLRPETLFGTKFESYLNQKETKQKLPKWFNKDSQNEQTTKEEREEMKNILEELEGDVCLQKN